MIENVHAMNKLEGAQAALDRQLKTNLVDLASERLGGETLACSDDFFAEMENLLKPGRGIFIEDKYTERGKWMDGWESRRSYGRDNGREFDWCVIRLGCPGVIRAIDVDTNYFRGNAPQSISLEACNSRSQPDANTRWTTLIGQSAVQAHSQNLFSSDSGETWTHVRLNIFPDGGVARLRVYGDVSVDWSQFVDGEAIDLASIKNGARALLVSDMFFSEKSNLIMPGRGKDMGDGWETKRRRDPGPDWSIVKLACAGQIQKLVIDTCHFKGNFPDSCLVEGILTDTDDFTGEAQKGWQPILPKTKLYAHREHLFKDELVNTDQPFTHVRLSIFPDGGVSRMRVIGKPHATSSKR